nr:aldo/keto reductase [Streptomyces sp. NBC_00998]
MSEYALGTANFGTGWGAGAELEEARRIFDQFAEAGGTFLDTADNYQFGESEELTGKFVSADRDHFVIGNRSVQNRWKKTAGQSPTILAS